MAAKRGARGPALQKQKDAKWSAAREAAKPGSKEPACRGARGPARQKPEEREGVQHKKKGKRQQGFSRASSLAPGPAGPRPRGALPSTLFAPSLAVSAWRDLGGGRGGEASRFVKAIAVGASELVSDLG